MIPVHDEEGVMVCENCGKPMSEHDAMAHCWPDPTTRLRERAEAAAQAEYEAARRRDVDVFIQRAQVGRHLLRKVFGVDSTIADWLPMGREAAITVDGVTLHTCRSAAYFGGVRDTLRYGDIDVRSLAHLGHILGRNP